MCELPSLKSLRKKQNLLQRDVAKTLGICTSAYNMLEKGSRRLTLDVAAQLADIFVCTIDDIHSASRVHAVSSTASQSHPFTPFPE